MDEERRLLEVRKLLDEGDYERAQEVLTLAVIAELASGKRGFPVVSGIACTIGLMSAQDMYIMDRRARELKREAEYG